MESRSPNRVWENTDRVETRRRRPPGGRFSTSTSGTWYRSTSLLSQLLPGECCWFLSFSPMIDGESSTSTSRRIRRHNGRRSSWSEPFRRVVRRIKSPGVEAVVTTPASRWQNACTERMIGSLRRELLDHVVILNQPHKPHDAHHEFFVSVTSTASNHLFSCPQIRLQRQQIRSETHAKTTSLSIKRIPGVDDRRH